MFAEQVDVIVHKNKGIQIKITAPLYFDNSVKYLLLSSSSLNCFVVDCHVLLHL